MAYSKELAATRLVPVAVQDLTAEAIPCGELRARPSHAYRGGSFPYLLMAADRV
ncbi:hypothetical protein ACFWUZ_01485 [Streptomyces sp. NPDC058646]|uniref:hypothetical protein n=1 Tax=Streptomyces sp. NPDC058646 TaxID=3346574 RepID=UPI00364AC7C8